MTPTIDRFFRRHSSAQVTDLRVSLAKGATTECFRLFMIGLRAAEVNDDMAGTPNGRGIQPATGHD